MSVFIGLGLIGGSIAKNIKKLYPEASLIAATSGEETLRQAHADGLIENDTFFPWKILPPAISSFSAAR